MTSGVFNINFEHISYLFLSVSIDDFEQVNISWKYVQDSQSFTNNYVVIINICTINPLNASVVPT